MHKFIPIVLLLIFSVASCTSTGSAERTAASAELRLGRNSTYTLAATACIQNEIAEFQKIEGRFEKRQFNFLAYTVADAAEITIILLNDMGIEIGSATYDGNTVSSSGFFITHNLPAEYLIADFQLVYYRPDCLETAFSGSDIRITEEHNEEGVPCRNIYEAGELISIIEYRGEVLTFTNMLRGYSYTIYSGEIQ